MFSTLVAATGGGAADGGTRTPAVIVEQSEGAENVESRTGGPARAGLNTAPIGVVGGSALGG
eukprot:8793112-Alexandrium_andersonii.AAC.1